MDKKRVVITGIGVLAANAIGKNAFWEAILNGVSGIKPVSLFDTTGFKVKRAGEIKDFSGQAFLGDKGLRTLDRSTKLIASAAKLALDDAHLEINEENTRQIGVAIGATFGSIKSICDFDMDGLKDGVRYVNPALFPNTVINSPASEVSIKFKIRGFNATVSTGFCAGLDAVNYARDFVRFGRANAVLAGGVEELCEEIFLGFYKTKFLDELDEPGGNFLGEAGAIVILEDLESALARQADILAEVAGFGTNFDQASGLKRAMRLALDDAGLKKNDINGFFSSSAIKSMVGECFSASGALQVAAAVGAIQKQPLKINRLMVNCSGPNGNNSSMIISKYS